MTGPPDSLPNAYDDAHRAESYATLGLDGTYYLAFRDVPELLQRHVRGRDALDFGCGAGRSTRVLKALGYGAVGVDVARDMLRKARQQDSAQLYVQIGDDGPRALRESAFDLVTAFFPFDNIAGVERRVRLMTELRRRLRPEGKLLLLASAPELYRNDWLTFTTVEFDENATAQSGDRVRIRIRGVGDDRPIDDQLWEERDYVEQLGEAGLRVLETHRPLGRAGEPFEWGTELEMSPWMLFVGEKRVR